MNTITLSKIIEAILLSSGRPLSEKEIVNLFDEEEKPSHSEFKDALDCKILKIILLLYLGLQVDLDFRLIKLMLLTLLKFGKRRIKDIPER